MSRLSCLATASLLLGPILSSCEINPVRPDTSLLMMPVLLGPVLRIGGEAVPVPPGRLVKTVVAPSGYNRFSFGTHMIRDIVSDTDEVANRLRAAVGRTRNPLLHVDSIDVKALMHVSLFGIERSSVILNTSVWDQPGRRRTETGR